jgi:glutathione S-transferase
MLRVHHLENSRSHRVLWLLEELGQPYEVVTYPRDPATLAAPAALRAVHPLGKSPVLEDDGIAPLAESGAILEYLLQRYDVAGRFAPARGTADWVRYLHWLHFAEGSAMTPLLLKLILNRIDQAPWPVRSILRRALAPLRARVAGQIGDQLAYMDAALAAASHFAGMAFSAADVQMIFVAEASAARGGLTATSHPRLWGWLERMRARPGWQRALEKGGALRLGF